jgi:hypothetical protein
MSDDSNFRFYELLLAEARTLREARRSTNNFFMSVNVAGLGGVGFLLKEGIAAPLIAGLALMMAFVCFLWMNSIGHYARLTSIKYKILREIEAKLPMQPIAEEWRQFTRGKPNQGASHIEKLVPLIFGLGYIALPALTLPWAAAAAPWLAQLRSALGI